MLGLPPFGCCARADAARYGFPHMHASLPREAQKESCRASCLRMVIAGPAEAEGALHSQNRMLQPTLSCYPPLNSRLKPHVHSRVPRTSRRWRRCGQILQEPTGCSGANRPEEWSRQRALHGYRRAICLSRKSPTYTRTRTHTLNRTQAQKYARAPTNTLHTCTPHTDNTHTHTLCRH